MKPVLLFDIDGTLLNVNRDFLFSVIESLLNELNIEKPKAPPRSFAGRTDRGIFTELIGDHEEKEMLFEKFKKRYTDEMVKGLSASEVNNFNGATEAVHYALENGYKVGLCTGNFREVAYAKIRAAGFDDDAFPFGGFGCNHENRNHLPGLAYREYNARYNDDPAPEQFLVIGDTPNDIRCARYFGARVIAVTTGHFSREDLHRYEPDLLLDSLGKPQQWLFEI